MGTRRGAPPRIPGIASSDLERLRAHVAGLKHEEPMFSEEEALRAAEKDHPTAVMAVRRHYRDKPNELRRWVKRAQDTDAPRDPPASALARARKALLGRGRSDLVADYPIPRLRDLVKRLEREGAVYPPRVGDEALLAGILIEFGVVSDKVLHPDEIEKARRRVEPNLDGAW